MIRIHDNQEHTTFTVPCLQRHSAQYYVRHSKAQSGAARDSSVRWRRTFKGNMSKSTRKLREMR